MRKISFSRQILTQLIFLLVALFILIPVWSTVRLAFDSDRLEFVVIGGVILLGAGADEVLARWWRALKRR